MSTIFDDVRGRVSIADAIAFLGLKATETKGDQLRFACPKCGDSDKRTLSDNLQKGLNVLPPIKRETTRLHSSLTSKGYGTVKPHSFSRLSSYPVPPSRRSQGHRSGSGVRRPQTFLLRSQT